MKLLPQLLLAGIVLSSVSVIHAEQTSTTASQEQQTYGYLGLGVDKVSDQLRSQLPDEVAATQGLLVTRFADNSPASDDGINVYDVLIAYDDQPIEDPEKFIEKVRKDTPKRVVKFKLVRQGKIITVPVTMGEQKVAPIAKAQATTQAVTAAPQVPQTAMTTPPTPYGVAPMPMPNTNSAMGNTPPPANFGGLAIRKVAEGIYEASISFVGADGKPQRRAYRGSHIQILQQVRAATDLSPQAKQQLLFALRPPKNKTSGWGSMPFGNRSNNMFNPNHFFKGWGF